MRTARLQTFLTVLAPLVIAGLGVSAQAQTNISPTVSISEPLDGVTAMTTNALFIDVAASDADGSVTQVALYLNGALVATSDSAPCEFEFPNPTAGTNMFVASATDNGGAVSYSDPVQVFELDEPPSYYAPQISLSSPLSNAVVIAPTNVTVVAQVMDRGWPVREVDFAMDNVDLGSITNPAFTWTVQNISLGTHTFVATVTDAGGYYASTPPLSISVIPNPATTPSVTVVSPTNGAVVPIGQPVDLSVSVAPQGNVIQSVDFYVSGVRLGSVTAPPYTWSWTPSQLGSACWYAVAHYGLGQTALSATSCVSVVLAPGGYPRYVVVDLGPLETNYSLAFGINGQGHIVGDWPLPGGNDRGYLDVGGVITVFGSAPLASGVAMAINDSDQILIDANQHGYIYQQGQVTDVGSLGGYATFIRAINASGQAVGDSQLPNNTSHAVLYDGRQLVDIGPSGTALLGQANAINDSGSVVGWAQGGTGQFAFRYDAQHGMQALPDPPGGSVSSAWGINNSGVILGDSYYQSTSTRRAFLYSNGVSRDLGTLGDPQTANSDAGGINNSNEVVGEYQDSSSQLGFLWVTNVMYDLNQLIPSGSNWRILQAVAINDAGQIVGTGTYGPGATQHAVLLNPLPGPGQTPVPPVVSLVTPTNNAVAPSGTDIPLLASVLDQDGYITNVSFYAQGQAIGATTSPPPFSITWSNAPAGIYQLTAVAMDNVGAVQTSASVVLNVQAPYPGAPRVAIISAAAPYLDADIRSKLVSTIQFSSVDVISVTASDPPVTLPQLLPYDAVLVYSFQPFGAPAALGDLLADYVDAGHGVVLGLYTGDTLKYPLAGRVQDQSYLPWAESRDNFKSGLTLVKLLPQNPILDGVESLVTGSAGYYQQNPVLAPGSVQVASWSNGQPLVAARQVGAGRLVDLNFFPVSSDVYSGWWQSNTDGARLMANALAWAAGPPAELATLSTVSNVVNYLPGQDITLTAGVTNALAALTEVDIYTNNALLVSLTNAPYTFTWPHPPIGNYLTAAVITDAQTNVLTTRPLPLSVDSRLSITLLTPTNNEVIYYPTDLLMQVRATDLDAPIVSVEYLLEGASEVVGVSTNPPFSYLWHVSTVGTFPISAVATDALGARHSSQSNILTVINYDPNKPVQTSWSSPLGEWLDATNWSDGVPRPQDTAYVDNGGTASVDSGLATAAALNIGWNSTGAVVQTTGDLSCQSITLGQNAGANGYYQLDGPGQLSVAHMLLGSAGSGHFVQNGGVERITNELVTAGNLGGQGAYELRGGVLICSDELIEGLQTDRFEQFGGTNSAGALVLAGSHQSESGAYYLSDGLLDVGTENLYAVSPQVATFVQYGGIHQVSQVLNLGLYGPGRLIFAGGSLTAAQLVMDTDGTLDITVGGQTNGIQVAGLAQFGGNLTLRLAPDYLPAPGDTWTLVNYGRYYNTFRGVTLPPATNGVDWQLSYQTNALVLTATRPPNLVVVSPVTAMSQSNLYYQIVQITNPGPQPLAGARVFIPGLPAGMQVYNASGSVDGVPYVEFNAPIAPGQTVQFYVQFVSQNAPGDSMPNLVVDLTSTNQVPPPPGQPLVLEPLAALTNGTFGLGFNSAVNQTYYIQYSGGLASWLTAPWPLIGTGSRLNWFDTGPPATATSPATQPHRFYRVMSGQ